MSILASLLITGNEVRDGLIQDTNSRTLVQWLRTLGFEIAELRTCGDERRLLERSILELTSVSDLLVITGGLGPTQDDYTREVLATVAGKPLMLDEQVLAQLKARFRRMGRTFDESNNRQAQFPLDSVQLENPAGTANGIYMLLPRAALSGSPSSKTGCAVVALPGVPSEILAMLPETAKLLGEDFPTLSRRSSVTLSIFGLAESQVAGLIRNTSLSSEVDIAFRFDFPCIFLTLSAENQDALDKALEQVQNVIEPDYIYAIGESATMLSESVASLLRELPHTVSGAESCTGGLISELLTADSGASCFFLGAAVTYANESKQQLLGVDASTLDCHGAVSAECAAEMARGARKAFDTALGFSVTGIAGPGGGSTEKPVGLFFIGLCFAGTVQAFRFEYPGSRERIRLFAAHCCLDLIRRHLGGMKLKKAIIKQEVDL